MYNKCIRILEMCHSKNLFQQKRLIATLILDFHSEEFALVQKAIRIDEQLSKIDQDTSEAKQKKIEFDTIVDKYAEIYIGKLCDEQPFIEPMHLFYGKNIGTMAEKLYRKYDEMLLNVIIGGQVETNQWFQELNAVINEMKKERTLESMRKKLPL